MPPRLRDERLAWLALEPRLRRRSTRPRLRDALGLIATIGLLSHRRRRHPAARMEAYSVAVDHVTGFLTDAERATLRRDNTLPGWFVGEVERGSRAVRRGRPLPVPRHQQEHAETGKEHKT